MREHGQDADNCTIVVQVPFRGMKPDFLGELPKGWLRGVDLNHRPLGYEPNELPGCSTPQIHLTQPFPESQGQLTRWRP